MFDQTIQVSASEVIEGLTLKIKIVGFKVAKIRMWLGVKIIVVACTVIGCESEIEIIDG